MCIWNLKLNFQNELKLYSANHAAYGLRDKWMDRQMDEWINKQGECRIHHTNLTGKGYNIPNEYNWYNIGLTLQSVLS